MNVSPDIGYLDTSVGRHVELTVGGPASRAQHPTRLTPRPAGSIICPALYETPAGGVYGAIITV